ncbi:hypothetical protein M9Y10_031400 [Tritrichomonas musculus]|uniref:Fungal lipase-type domain-containing protein n=1 Tax=Tritrichomonas musculus TaxID=1915356 RepID=A0ABR2H0N2_9EUKA
MYTNREIHEFENLLYTLNDNNANLPNEYHILGTGGGTDGIPHFKLLINYTKQLYVIWVRGTDFTDVNDILINIRTTPIDFYEGQCHRGYYFSARIIIELIRNDMTNTRINRIVCLGHSLGGAVASVIATILQKGDHEHIRNINNFRERFVNDGGISALVFGTPPTFSANISTESRNYITNFILIKDIVPKLGQVYDSLSRFQIRLVTMLFYQNHAINNPQRERELLRHNQVIMRQGLQTNRLPGSVISLDLSRREIRQASNTRLINSYLDYIGVFHHILSKYHNAIIILIVDNNELFNVANINFGQNGGNNGRTFEICVEAVVWAFALIGTVAIL